jgi:hypothetical protein
VSGGGEGGERQAGGGGVLLRERTERREVRNIATCCKCCNTRIAATFSNLSKIKADLDEGQIREVDPHALSSNIP